MFLLRLPALVDIGRCIPKGERGEVVLLMGKYS